MYWATAILQHWQDLTAVLNLVQAVLNSLQHLQEPRSVLNVVEAVQNSLQALAVLNNWQHFEKVKIRFP